jgi:hypothetical protein
MQSELIDLVSFHDEVDRRAASLAARHKDRLQCGRGCSDCCVDEIRVLEVEAELIRRDHADLLATGTPHPAGKCAFLDGDGACRIYESRPYVCRTEGLPFRWTGADDDGSPIENRDICPLNDEGEAITGIDPDDCWLLGPHEERLADIQDKIEPGKRVPLRELFSLQDSKG